MEPLKPNAGRAKTAIILLWIVMALDLIDAIFGYMKYQRLQTATYGDYLNEEEVTANDILEALLGLVYMVAFIISIVMFIRWFRRAYYNLHLKTEYLKYSEGWAAGAWFVPVLSLFRPYEIMKELYVETDRILVERAENYTSKNNNTVIGFWWALWIISSFIGNIIFRSSLDDQTINGMINDTQINIVLSLISIPLGLLAIKLVKDYSQMETKLAELKEPSQQPGGLSGEEPVRPAL